MGFEGITGGPGGSYKLRKIVGLSNYSYRRPEKGEEIRSIFLLFWGVFHEKKKRVRIFFYCGHYFHTYFGQELPPVSMSAILV